MMFISDTSLEEVNVDPCHCKGKGPFSFTYFAMYFLSPLIPILLQKLMEGLK